MTQRLIDGVGKMLDKTSHPEIKSLFLVGPRWNNSKPDEDSCAVCVILTDQFMSLPPNGLYFTGLL